MFGKRPSTLSTTPPIEAGQQVSAPCPTPEPPSESAGTRAIVSIKPDRPEPNASQRRGQSLLASQQIIHSLLYERIDGAAAARLPREELLHQVLELIGEIVVEQRLSLTGSEQSVLGRAIVDDMVGLGPLEELLNDETITDIMVNRPASHFHRAADLLRNRVPLLLIGAPSHKNQKIASRFFAAHANEHDNSHQPRKNPCRS